MQKAGTVIYAVLAWLFLAGVVVQVFLAGLVVVAGVSSWEGHVGLGHGLGLPLILMLPAMYAGRMSRTTKRWTWVLFAVYLFQADFVIFLRDSVPYLSALHPVLALVDFALGWRLAWRASGAVANLNESEVRAPTASISAE